MQVNRSTWRRMAAFAGLLAVTLIASTAASRHTAENAIAGSSIRYVGPFYSTQQSFDSTAGGQVGGEVRIYLAASTDTLRIGDVVFESANNTAGKSATASNHEKVLGVVVGGRSTDMACSLLSADVATIAALPNRPVIVLRRGRTYVRVDSITATDTVHAGDRIKPSTLRAGFVMPATSTVTATAAANTQGTTTIAYTNADTIRSGGTTVTSTAANGAIIGHSAATITNGTLTAGAVTVAGDGFNKVFGTAVKLTVPGGTLLADINAR